MQPTPVLAGAQASTADPRARPDSRTAGEEPPDPRSGGDASLLDWLGLRDPDELDAAYDPHDDDEGLLYARHDDLLYLRRDDGPEYDDDAAPPLSDVPEALLARPRYRAAKRPQFLMIPHVVLRDPRLCNSAAALFAVQLYLSQREGRVSLARIAEWFGLARPTMSGHAKRLRKMALLDEYNCPTPDAFERLRVKHARDGTPYSRPGGDLQVSFASIAALGLKGAIAAAAMRSTRALRHVLRVGERLAVGARLIAHICGNALATARKRVRELVKAHEVEVQPRRGHTPLVHVLSEAQRLMRVEAEQKRAAAEARAKRAATPREGAPPPPRRPLATDELASASTDVLAALRARPLPDTPRRPPF